MHKLTAVLVTRNEEKKIARCMGSLRWVDEIVVIDQSSTDATAAICRKFTDKVFVVPEKGYCEPDRPVAVQKASNEWILYVDADEEISAGLRQEIERLLSGEPSLACYYVPRRNIFMGRWIRGSGWYPGHVLRLFKKGSAGFSDRIHTDVLPLSACGRLENPIDHHTCENLEEYLHKVNRYTTVLARQEYDKGVRIGCKNVFQRFFFLPLAQGANKFILKRGFRDGLPGIVIASLTVMTIVLMNAKLWELQKNGRAAA